MNGPEQSLELLGPGAYATQLAAAISTSKRQVSMASMVFALDERTGPIIKLLEGALQRGVGVTIVTDIYTRHFLRKQPKASEPGQRMDQTFEAVARLEKLGAGIIFTGTLSANPYKGRMHAKFSVVDNTVFAFGGINFHDESFRFHDYMLRYNNAATAIYLHSLAAIMKNGMLLRDESHILDKTHTILVDSGNAGKSIIYETAFALAQKAKTMHYISQMSPSGRLAQAIRKTDYQCYFNKPANTSFPTSLSILVDSSRHGIRNSYQQKQYIHAKYILFIMPNGEKHVLTGSHNFSWRGVAYGTKEIALHSTDEAMWNQLYNFMQSELA